jgi:hypothetical protein
VTVSVSVVVAATGVGGAADGDGALATSTYSLFFHEFRLQLDSTLHQTTQTPMTQIVVYVQLSRAECNQN